MPKLLQKAPNRIHHITREAFDRSQEPVYWGWPEDRAKQKPMKRGASTTCRVWSLGKNLTDNWRFVNCPSCLKYCPPEFQKYHQKR